MTTLDTPNTARDIQILVVDDHPNTAATLSRVLNQLGPGVNVVSASSGFEALEKAKATGVDILITDMIMPEMTGLELIDKLQYHPGGKPAFTYLVTAYDVPGLKVTAQRLKVNEVIVKPFRPERIYQIISHAIEEIKIISRPIPQNHPKPVKRKFNILVADDRPDNVTLLMRYLAYEGYDSFTAKDGVETLEKIRDELPDLVLLDVNMPRKDGFSVLEEMRADPSIAYIPVIILTAARLDPIDIQAGLNLGADDYVTKPFDRLELMARIKTKLRVKEAEDVIRRRNRELNLLPEIGKELSARFNMDEISSILLKRTVETLGAMQGDILMLDEPGNITENYTVSLASDDKKTRFTLNDKLVKKIQENRQGVIISNALKDPLWKKDADSPIRSAAVVPLFGRLSLLGLLVLTHEQGDYFTIDHLLLLQAIASQAAIALENMRLYSEVTQKERWLNSVLQNIDEAILIFDGQGRLNMANSAGEKLFVDYKNNLNHPLPEQGGYDALRVLLEKARDLKTAVSDNVLWPDQKKFSARITPLENGGQAAFLRSLAA